MRLTGHQVPIKCRSAIPVDVQLLNLSDIVIPPLGVGHRVQTPDKRANRAATKVKKGAGEIASPLLLRVRYRSL
jgi:hypothetical protein